MGGCEPTDPEQAGFPSARQVASLTRLVLRKDKTSKETVRLITSLDAGKASGKDLKKIKRDYWGIESKLHYRLDNVLDGDRSREWHISCYWFLRCLFMMSATAVASTAEPSSVKWTFLCLCNSAHFGAMRE